MLYLYHVIEVIFNICLQLAIASPKWQVIHKLKVAKFVDKVGRDCIFLTVCEAVDSFVGSKFTGPGNC